jgi:hypothetical protein
LLNFKSYDAGFTHTGTETMKKEFNITGACRAEEHYMMDDSRRFSEIMDYVERG